MKKMRKRTRIACSIISMVLIVAMFSTTAFAASYASISRKFSGYGVSVSKIADYPIVTETVSELKNSKSYAVTTTDTFTYSQDITFSSSCDTSISSSISATTGVVSGKLGSAISKSYSFTSNYKREYSKSITVTIPAKSTYSLKVTTKGDKVTIYYKHFSAWITTSKGNGIVYVPKYYSYTCL